MIKEVTSDAKNIDKCYFSLENVTPYNSLCGCPIQEKAT